MRVFVVGTGRCGSLSVGRWLQDNDVLTEMESYAKRLCQCVEDKVRGDRWNRKPLEAVWSRTPLNGVIVDNNLSLFIEDLAAMGPCRFIWLIRNPWDCISSLMAWKWYRERRDIEPNDVFAKRYTMQY